MRLVAPGLRMLFLGAAALSKYALNELSADISSDYLEADVVLIIGVSGKSLPTELNGVLQLAHPSVVVITPAALSPKQRKEGELPLMLLPPDQASWQFMQTAQLGNIQITNSENGWSINTI